MIALLQAVATMAATCTDGTLFATDQDGIGKITYHRHVMPPRDAAGKNMPFCLVKARGFRLHPGNSRQIELLYCLYQPDRDQAMTDLTTLEGLLDPLAKRGPHWQGLGAWKLQSVTGWGGDRDTGVQPHPEYYLTVLLDFVGP